MTTVTLSPPGRKFDPTSFDDVAEFTQQITDRPPCCCHSRAQRIEDDQFYCPSCCSVVFEHDFEER